MKTVIKRANVLTGLGIGLNNNHRRMLSGKTAIKQHKLDGYHGPPFPYSRVSEEHLSLKGETRLEKMILGCVQELDEDLSETLLILSTTKGDIDHLISKPVEHCLLANLSQRLHTGLGVKESLVVSNACVSGTQAVLMAKRFLETDHYKNALVIGADAVTPFTLAGFESFKAVSSKPCRPFDKHRDGISIGDGVGYLLLEIKKPHPGDVTVVGGATSNDANHISGPSMEGIGQQRTIQTMLELWQTQPEIIQAHGTATKYNDSMESTALRHSSLNHIPLYSLKGYIGHTLGAAGVIEIAMAWQSLIKQEFPCSLGFQTADDGVDINVLTKALKVDITKLLKLASGFGGVNAVVGLEKVRH